MAEIGGNAGKQILGYVERVEHLIEERKGISDDIKDILQEAKSNGFDVPTIRLLIKERAIEANTRVEKHVLFDTYAAAIGLLI